jgi:hypothetical protein
MLTNEEFEPLASRLGREAVSHFGLLIVAA